MPIKIVLYFTSGRYRWVYADNRELALELARLAEANIKGVCGYKVQEDVGIGFKTIMQSGSHN